MLKGLVDASNATETTGKLQIARRLPCLRSPNDILLAVILPESVKGRSW